MVGRIRVRYRTDDGDIPARNITLFGGRILLELPWGKKLSLYFAGILSANSVEYTRHVNADRIEPKFCLLQAEK